MDVNEKKSSSASALLSTLIPVAAVAAVLTVLFIIFRSKYARVYTPRTHLESLRDNEKTTQLPGGKFNWIKTFRRIPDDYLVNHASLDGYLYLRFLKMLTVICFVGCLITWPVLFPVNATGGAGRKQLDILTFGNISDTQKNRYYAHTFLSWIFFSFVMYIITRETIYLINLRHAYLLAPVNAWKISSKTILFTFVANEYLNPEKLAELFGGTTKRAWFVKDCKVLEKTIEDRDKAALKLEAAEIKLSVNANKRRLKAEKKAAKGSRQGKNKLAAMTTPTVHPPSVADPEAGTETQSQWLVKKDRPSHRLGKIPLIGKKVDTIEWARTELGTLVPDVEKTQASYLEHGGRILPSVFIEFTSQRDAEHAFRSMTTQRSPHMVPRAISVHPSQIVWKNLGMSKSQRRLRVLLTTAFLTVMIMYWAIPVAVIGAISNINYLTDKVSFLSFINDIPSVILGVVTGLLPAVLLIILVALVPIICRWMAKLSGEVTLREVELKGQNWYFAFQVVNVFLITTFSSGAASVVTDIINTPDKATSLLAKNLPSASNFYLSYIIVQCLGIASGTLLNIGSLVGFLVLGRLLDKSPRKMFKRYITLAGLGWGSLYPKFTCLGVIALSYSCIAPLVLGFATIGFALIYIATRYNAFFVLTNDVDTQGLSYSKALQQLFVGLYIAEVCLLGLFSINKAPGPIVLMAVFLAATAIYHAILRRALKPLTMYLPDSFENQSELFSTGHGKPYDASTAGAALGENQTAPETTKLATKRTNFFSRIFDPRNYKSHAAVKALIPSVSAAGGLSQSQAPIAGHAMPNDPAKYTQVQDLTLADAPPAYSEQEENSAYHNPAITSPSPKLWLVRDEMGISRQECEENNRIAAGNVTCSDNYAWLDAKGKICWEKKKVRDAPIWEKRVDY